MLSDAKNYCRVCGYEPTDAPWGPDGTDPSWEICPCCGVEFGYEDATASGVVRFREQWLGAGAPWSDAATSRDGLGVEGRLARVMPGFGWEMLP